MAKKENKSQPKYNSYWIYGIIISVLLLASMYTDGSSGNVRKTNISEFEKFLNETAGEIEDGSVSKSKWIIRMEFDPETLLEKNITMDDIHYAINSSYGNEITCVYSDFNSNNLIFRIRMNNSVISKNKKQNPQWVEYYFTLQTKNCPLSRCPCK